MIAYMIHIDQRFHLSITIRLDVLRQSFPYIDIFDYKYVGQFH